MSHDFETQRAETVATYNELQAENDLPDMADIDYFLVPGSADVDWRPLADVLTRNGFICEFIEDDGDEPYLVATVLDQALSVEGVWISEEVATKFALDHGFRPDGWGFAA
ncbi:MAG: ribonuclease E inhibitor RraB [Pelagimonas sp.]|jgi:hypothetical protein|nr:ribonuclease E inhibitor RraB [Pelagimonas sp.]